MWQFDAYYHMNELIDFCYGKVDTDFQVICAILPTDV